MGFLFILHHLILKLTFCGFTCATYYTTVVDCFDTSNACFTHVESFVGRLKCHIFKFISKYGKQINYLDLLIIVNKDMVLIIHLLILSLGS
jgi:hypothetical protein